jgi:hypothetical protein
MLGVESIAILPTTRDEAQAVAPNDTNSNAESRVQNQSNQDNSLITEKDAAVIYILRYLPTVFYNIL